MNKFSACGISLLLLASPLWAEPPKLVLPKEVSGNVGGFIEVPAETDGTAVVWVPLSEQLNLFPVRLLKDTKTMVVTSQVSGTYRILAYTAKGDEPSLPAFTTITVGVPVPPTPTPTPTPTPSPEVPEGAWGLTRLAYTEALKLPAPSRGNCAGVAFNMEGVASAISAGTLNDLEKVYEQVRLTNNITLANDKENWRPWFAVFSARMEELDQKGQVTTVTNTADALRAVATGLRAASNVKGKR